jgi:hypothetical protein
MKTKDITVETPEQLNEPKRYQWRKGDQFGNVVIFEREDDQFVYFTNGSKIFKTVLNEFMFVVEGDELPLPMQNEGPNNVEKMKKMEIDSRISPDLGQQISSKSPEQTPLEKLILKLSKKNSTEINVPIKIGIPKVEVVDMLIENSDDDREAIIEAIMKMAIEQIDIHTLQQELKDKITSHLNNYYNE